ncbi:riboflavin synthase domain-like protein [Rozella allomycis CSF55]|uniref:Riboflavin synthase domain-like protein n=1 Tax=Rozella allomycis (strain CSF55) TaxID=988480 RepID=A0A4P9YGZ1_ROZAC|nr:riboflavin synthase domain-like protein [Rozella allomycis CSF55]
MTLLSSVIILYGSQTGNAEWIANNINHIAKLRGFKSECFVLDDFEKVCSYSILIGLGDSSYANFCNNAKRIERKLIEFGATNMMETGLADDDLGLELVVDPWVENLFIVLDDLVYYEKEKRVHSGKVILEEYINNGEKMVSEFNNLHVDESNYECIPLPIPKDILKDYPKLTNIAKLPNNLFQVSTTETTSGNSIDKTRVELCSIEAARCLTSANAIKKTINMKLKLETEWEYMPGDCVAIHCPNDSRLVDRIMRRLNLSPDENIKINWSEETETKAVPSHLISCNTIRGLLTNSLDLHSFPKKAFFRSMAEFCSDPEEKNILLFLCSKQDIPVNVLDILAHFESCKPSIQSLIETLTPLQPRLYSISSSPLDSKSSVEFAFNVIENELNVGDKVYTRGGLCTSWLDSMLGCLPYKSIEWTTLLDKDYKLCIKRKPSSFFNPPSDQQTPIIMIGPGTGVTPFIGFLRHKEIQQVDSLTWLFYGCRYENDDYLFRQDIDRFINNKTLIKYDVCFSREQEKSLGHKYVQHRMIHHGKELFQWIEERNATVYVCGDAKNMAKDVNDALIEIAMKFGGMDIKHAIEWLNNLVNQKRYLRDIWA